MREQLFSARELKQEAQSSAGPVPTQSLYRYGSSVQKCCKPSLQVNNRAGRTDPDAELTLSRAGLSSTMYSPPFSDAAASDLAGDQATISNLSEGGLLDSPREPEQKPFALMSAAKEAKMAICMQGGPSERSSGRRSSAEAGQPVVGCRWLTPPPSPPSQVLAPCQAPLPTPPIQHPCCYETTWLEILRKLLHGQKRTTSPSRSS